jgi:hypothetical protein
MAHPFAAGDFKDRCHYHTSGAGEMIQLRSRLHSSTLSNYGGEATIASANGEAIG